MSPQEDGHVVATVRVKHAKATPDEVYQFRARLQALSSAGTLQSVTVQSVKEALKNFSGEEVRRFTEIKEDRVVNDGYLSETSFVKVEVKTPLYDEDEQVE